MRKKFLRVKHWPYTKDLKKQIVFTNRFIKSLLLELGYSTK